MTLTPLYTGDIVLIRSIRARVEVWRTLKEMRLANGMRPNARCWAYTQPFYPNGTDLYGVLHFARTAPHLELVGHEVQHLLSHICRWHELDHRDHDDEETVADIGGKLVSLVYEEVQKCMA